MPLFCSDQLDCMGERPDRVRIFTKKGRIASDVGVPFPIACAEESTATGKARGENLNRRRQRTSKISHAIWTKDGEQSSATSQW